MNKLKTPKDSPTCWSAALNMEQLQRHLRREWPNKRFTDLPEHKDFPILFDVRHWEGDICELTFFGFRDAKYLLSLDGMHIE